MAKSKESKKVGIGILAIIVGLFILIIGVSSLGETDKADTSTTLSSSDTSSVTEATSFDNSTTTTGKIDPAMAGVIVAEKSTESKQSTKSSSHSTTKKSVDKVASVSRTNIPTYKSSPYVIVNNNNPTFTSAEKKNKTAFEKYSSLDSKGRCGTAYANICKQIMPTQKREGIGSVKPSGWQIAKFDFVDGKYLFNRCHLIGFQLAGENANEKNLITGTRYMNVQGMLPFENMVADYVKETNNHVLYRVTPIFAGNELVARGVQIEAYSVEDNGSGICFNIYCFNVQPGVAINYTNGGSALEGQTPTTKTTIKSTAKSSTEKTTKTTAKSTTKVTTKSNIGSSDCSYIGNVNSNKFHYPNCASAKKMNEENKIYFHGTRDEVINQGYEPCEKCNP